MRACLIFIWCFICIIAHAQDTIYKRNGDIVPAKVLEVNIKDISYKRSDLLNGPLFIINKTDIKKIRYATGTIDSFAVAITAPPRQLVMRAPMYIPVTNPNKISPTYRRGFYQFQNHRISDRNVMFIAIEKNADWKNAEIDLNVRDYRRNKLLQYTIGLGGAFIGGVGLYGSAIGTGNGSTHDVSIAGFAAILCSGILVSSQIVSFQYKLKRLKNTNNTVELYNRLSGNE